MLIPIATAVHNRIQTDWVNQHIYSAKSDCPDLLNINRDTSMLSQEF